MAISGGINWVTVQKALQDWVVSCTGLAEDHVVWGQQQAPRPTQPAIIMRLTINDDNNRPWLDTETNPLVLSTITVDSVDDVANTFTKTAHGLLTGDGPVVMGGADLPLNITVDTNYWVIRVDDNTFQLADGFVNAMNGVALDLGDSGSGVITLDSTTDTLRAGEEITYLQRSLLKATLTLECYTNDSVGLDMATAVLWRIHAKRLLPTQYAILSDADISIIEVDRVRAMGGTQGQYLYEPRAMLDVALYLASEDSEGGGIIERAEITHEDDDGNVLNTFTVDANPASVQAALPKQLVIIAGQSNALGPNTPPNAGTPYAAVQMYDYNALLGDPITWREEAWRDLQGRSEAYGSYGVGDAGVEISMGRTLDAAGTATWYIAKMAIDGSGLENNWVNASYPSTPPSLLDQFKTFITDRIADSGAELAAIVWIQGENDATESPDAANYSTNLATLDTALRAEFGNDYLFLVHRLSSNYAGLASATIRAAEESFAVGKSNAVITYADDLPFSDTAHYTGAACETLGERMAQAILDYEDGVTKTAPYWKAAGVPVAALGSGGATPSWPTHETGDIGVLVIAGIGNTNYAAPSGWTQFPDSPQHDSASGLNARLQVFWKRAASSGETAPTIADVGGDDAKIATIFTIGGCAASGDPYDVTAGATAASGTSVSLPGDTSTVTDGLVLLIVGHEVDASTAQLSNWNNASLTDLEEHMDVCTTNGGGAGFAVATARKATAGVFGNTTATLATASTQAMMTIVMKS